MKRKPVLEADNGFADHGGYMAAKITKLEEQFHSMQSVCAEKSKLFEGISIFVNGYTNPSADELKKIMLQHSGEVLKGILKELLKFYLSQEHFTIIKDRTQNS